VATPLLPLPPRTRQTLFTPAPYGLFAMQRRSVIAATGGIVTGATALSVIGSQEARGAVEIGSFDIQNFDKSVQGPVSTATLSVSGAYSVQSDVIPDRLILRLEAKQGLEYGQIASETVDSELGKDMGGTYTLEGNLLDSDVTAPDLSPANIGERKTVGIDVRVTLDVRYNGRVIKSYEATDSSEINVEKTAGETTISMDGSGSLSLTES